MSAKNRWTMFGVLPGLLVLASMAQVEAASFRILGTRNNGFGNLVSAVSANGTTAVGSYSFWAPGMPPGFFRTYRYPRGWSADGEVLSIGNEGSHGVLLSFGDFEGTARGVSADGSVVIGGMGDNVLGPSPPFPQTGEAYRWTPGGGVVGLGYLTEGAIYSSAFAISADGSTVVGQSDSDSGRPAFRWTQSEGMVSLGTLPGHNESRAESVSVDGSVIVGSSGASADEAFRWTADGGMVGLGRLGDHLDSSAEDVSADGSVVVGYSGNRNRNRPPPLPYTPKPPDEDYEAFVWTEADGMVGLGHLPAHGWSKAYAVSADGSIVVGASYPVEDHGVYSSMGPAEAFIWDAEHGMRSLRDLLINEYQLELPDWPLGHPTGISADGKVIVGNGSDPGAGDAWMVVIPEPSTIVLALTGLVGLLLYAWRKRRRASRALQCRPRPLAAWSVLLALPLLLSVAEVRAASFRIIGTSSVGWESHYTTVSGVSADGTTAVGSYSYHPEVGQSYRYARRWNAHGVVLDGIEGATLSVSDEGSVVVGQWDRRMPLFGGSSIEAFRWTPQTGAIGLGYLDGGGGYSSASGVSADGATVVGQSSSDSRYRAFRWTQSEGMVSLETLPGHNTSRAGSVSADGSVIVGSSSSDSAAEAFRWTAGGMVGLGRLGDHIDSYAYDVSADGSVVVGWSGTGIHSAPYPLSGVAGDEAFLWTESGGMIGLGHLSGHGWSQASAVSADGSTVIGASAPVEDHGEYRSVGTHEPFIWDAAHGMRSLTDLFLNEYGLELPDWPLGHPSDISSDGTVMVGNGGNGLIVYGGAWIATIPEPSSGVLAVTGLLGLLAYTWRKRRHAA